MPYAVVASLELGEPLVDGEQRRLGAVDQDRDDHLVEERATLG